MSKLAYIDIAANVLGIFVSHMPKTFRIAGSDYSRQDGIVRLVLQSEEITGPYRSWQAVISDDGCTRTLVMKSSS